MDALDPRTPFVLLDDARPDGRARLYRDPQGEIRADELSEVRPALEKARTASRKDVHLAGYISYEAGLALEPRLQSRRKPNGSSPLLWFGLFAEVETFPSRSVPEMLPNKSGAWAGKPQPRTGRGDYIAKAEQALALIGAGDIYQVNLSFRADIPFLGTPLALYARMREAGGGGWGGVVFDGTHWLLSCSPELFFELDDRHLTARPMKGTVPAQTDRQALLADPKQRAENLMIVDLIRNDLARVSEPGSIAVPALFTIETYPTVHSLTSTVTGRLKDGCDSIDVIEALMPCGSITGAPKIRAMEIISDLETDPRGPYTGAIGYIDPCGDAAFNVAIRTLKINEGAPRAELGLGSAIVADSRPEEEWRECLAKGAFVTAAVPPFDLLETMRFDAEAGLVELERHLARLKRSASAFGFEFDRHALRNDLQAATFRLRTDRRIRLRVSPTGATAIEVGPVPASPAVAEVALMPRPVAREDFRLAHKTSDRDFYDRCRQSAGRFEVVFFDEEGLLTEGSFTNIFVLRDGFLLTPPLARGLLPGVLRERLLEEGEAEETDLRAEDLDRGFLIGNALRGLLPARLVAGAGQARL